jgi:hypothetical protein
MQIDWKSDFSEILSLWARGDENNWLHFTEIGERMDKKNQFCNKKRWYTKKVQRRLDLMVKQRILEKEKKGANPSAAARYRPTFEANEFDANQFFEGIRNSCKQKGLILKEEESLLVYGITSRENLTNLERAVLDHTLGQIEDAFENLLLLKQSIKAREIVGQPMDSELLSNFVKYAIAAHLSNRISTEAELILSEESRKEQFSGFIEAIVKVAKRNKIVLRDSGELIAEEKKLMVHDAKRLDFPIYVPIGSDADLAILKTLPPYRLEEYELNPFSHIRKLIENWEVDFKEDLTIMTRKPNSFDDADLFHIAQAFVRHMSPLPCREGALTFDQIERLAEWGRLTVLLGTAMNHEKLVRCVYHFWSEHQALVKANKEAEETWQKLSPDEQQKLMEPHEATVKFGEVDITKLERVTPEVLAVVKTKMPVKLEQKFVKK